MKLSRKLMMLLAVLLSFSLVAAACGDDDDDTAASSSSDYLGDGSLGTVLAVQGGLALRTLALFGSPEQQARWLQGHARERTL